MKTIQIKFDYSELCTLHNALNIYKVHHEGERKKEKDPVKKERIYQIIFNADKLQDVIDAARGTF